MRTETWMWRSHGRTRPTGGVNDWGTYLPGTVTDFRGNTMHCSVLPSPPGLGLTVCVIATSQRSLQGGTVLLLGVTNCWFTTVVV